MDGTDKDGNDVHVSGDINIWKSEDFDPAKLGFPEGLPTVDVMNIMSWEEFSKLSSETARKRDFFSHETIKAAKRIWPKEFQALISEVSEALGM